jgi:hypothetical protein
MEVVGGSIPLATTISPTHRAGLTRRLLLAESISLWAHSILESLMLKFFGSAVGIIFLIGLVVVILLLKFIF